jgi:serine/threonine protein kinase
VDKVVSERFVGETTRLGSYEIVRKLARGGMAEVFLARAAGRVVVLKKILPKYADSARMVQLFLDEARLAGSLDHPHIVKVYETSKDAGNLYFAMEYVHGQDVRSMLHRMWQVRERMPLRHAVQIATQVGAALHYAHEKRRPDGSLLNIVHRDVSPSNVIVSYDGAVKLLDFGVAKATGSSIKTRTGTLKGKISYMSPEQAKGAKIDRRSDVFSLGIVLWEMITTQRLFKADNDLATLQLIITRPPRAPSEVQPACPAELDRIAVRALSPDPAARYATADEMVRELQAVLDELGPGEQSLPDFVAEVFAPEVRSWHEARARGVALHEHVGGHGDLTVPVSESDFVEALDLDELDDLDEHLEDFDSIEPAPPVIAAGSVPPPAAHPRTQPASRPPTPARPMTPAVPPPAVRSHTPVHELPTTIATEFAETSESNAPKIPVTGPWPAGGVEVPAVPHALAAVSLPFQLDPAVRERWLRRGLQVGAAIVALIVLIAIVKGCGNSSEPAGPPAASRPSTP